MEMCYPVCGEAPHLISRKSISDSTFGVVRERALASANGIMVTIP
ncbi:rCG48765 [Rattus norvegicus]|uniref:RCG48765 n=1 Tax=Rattus norvegicus TaxID=10116 RepID=A6IG61_RAT|nr:rCG48765 [Rattus norvegicus]